MPREPKVPSPHPALPPLRSDNRDSDSESYETWSRHTVTFYHNPSTTVADWVVTEMRWYKNRGRLEHEYVVFKIQQQSANPPVEVFLRFDRRSTSILLAKEKTKAILKQEDFEKLSAQEKNILTKAVKEETDLLNDRNYFIRSLRKSSSSLDRGVEADDTVTHTRNGDGLAKGTPERADIMVTYSQFRNPFCLRDLAIITQTLAEYSDTYLLLLNQCYWMARTLVNIVVAMYEPQPTDGIPTVAFARAGKLTAAPFLPVISRDNVQEVARLVDIVRAVITEDDKQIDAAHESERRLQNQLSERDKQLAEHRRQLADQNQKLAERDQELTESQQKLAESQQELQRLRQALAERNLDVEPSQSRAGQSLAATVET